MIVGSIVAAYAAIVSTLSLILSVRVYRAGDPDVSITWEYDEVDRKLLLSVMNTGRADITIASVDLQIVHRQILNRSPTGKYYQMHTETIGVIPVELWWPDLEPKTFPMRLASKSLVMTQVKNDQISLPTDHPLSDLLLKFVASFPGGRKAVYMRGDALRHFVGIDQDRPITFPSPGTLPFQE